MIPFNPIAMASLFLISASSYIAIRTFSPFSGDWMIKIIPIAVLLYWVIQTLTGKTKVLMTIALLCSMVGDVLLSLDGLFIPGLGAFLLAQLTYTYLFLSQFQWQWRRLSWVLMIVLYTAICAAGILPTTGDLKWVVTAYLCAIMTMAISAGFRKDEHFLISGLGAFTFMISDTLIAVNKFVLPFAGAGMAIMVTYYLAQWLIAFGIVRHQIRQ
jgi:uncharacterized membrane protein YhhN